MAYFDYNATTPLNPAAREAYVSALDSRWANPSSPYAASAQVHNALETARAALRDQLAAADSQLLVFTGGATEANNAVIRHLSGQLSQDKTLLTSPFEHPSVAEAATRCFKGRLRLLSSRDDGTVDLSNLERMLLSGDVGAVSVMAVNNETGVIQPWEDIAERCNRSGIPFHCDASQWFGKCSQGRFERCDYLVGCGHKFGGPKGVGFIALSQNALGFRGALGGGQEAGRRGGTENVPAILSMVAALENAGARLEAMCAQETRRDGFEAFLASPMPEIICIGKTATRVPNTSFLVMPRFENIRWVRKLDMKGFQVSTGSACATGKTGSSAVLNAIGIGRDAARRTIRVSAGPDTTPSDWNGLADAFLQVWDDLNRSNASPGSEVISI